MKIKLSNVAINKLVEDINTSNNEEDMELLIMTLEKMIYFYIRKMFTGLPIQDVEDYYQDGVIVLLESIPLWDGRADFRAFFIMRLKQKFMRLISHRNYSLCRSPETAYRLHKEGAEKHIVSYIESEKLDYIKEE